MPVPKYATHYKMDHKKRGIALIFNHETFECGNLKSRAGTNEDCQNFKECLSGLGFDVKVFKDLSYSQLDNQVKKGRPYCRLDCNILVNQCYKPKKCKNNPLLIENILA